MKIIN